MVSATRRDDETQIDVLDTAVRPPDARLTNDELGRKIEEALATLGEDQRMAFVLREYEGLDYQSIAQVMGVSEGTVKSRLHRAKEALRSRLSRYVRLGT
jgi:RNA polymerase sigma-70 factor (ECF subfamily)